MIIFSTFSFFSQGGNRISQRNHGNRHIFLMVHMTRHLLCNQWPLTHFLGLWPAPSSLWSWSSMCSTSLWLVAGWVLRGEGQIIHIKQKPNNSREQPAPRLDWALTWFFGGDIDSSAGRPRSSGVMRPHWDVICGAAFYPADNGRRLISYSPLHAGCVFPFTSTPVPHLKSDRAEPQKHDRHLKSFPLYPVNELQTEKCETWARLDGMGDVNWS